MNDREILEKIDEALDEHRGDKVGGSGHLSYVTISDVKIDHKEEVTIRGAKHLKVQYSYTVDIESEFSYAEDPDPDKEPDPDDPYHYRENAEITIPLESPADIQQGERGDTGKQVRKHSERTQP